MSIYMYEITFNEYVTEKETEMHRIVHNPCVLSLLGSNPRKPVEVPGVNYPKDEDDELEPVIPTWRPTLYLPE